MIKNFEEFKKQINELADLINKFKSEAVQLKIVFGDADDGRRKPKGVSDGRKTVAL